MGEKLSLSRSRGQCAKNRCTIKLIMVESGTSSAIRGWARVRVLGYGLELRNKRVKSHDCALTSDLVKANFVYNYS